MLARVHLYVERVQGGPKIQRKIRESRIAGVVIYVKGVLEIEKRIFKNSLEIDEVFFFSFEEKFDVAQILLCSESINQKCSDIG